MLGGPFPRDGKYRKVVHGQSFGGGALIVTTIVRRISAGGNRRGERYLSKFARSRYLNNRIIVSWQGGAFSAETLGPSADWLKDTCAQEDFIPYVLAVPAAVVVLGSAGPRRCRRVRHPPPSRQVHRCASGTCPREPGHSRSRYENRIRRSEPGHTGRRQRKRSVEDDHSPRDLPMAY